MNEWHELFDQARSAFVQQRTFERARLLGASGLACLGRHTLSGLLCAAGQQFTDWSSSYRLFEHERLDLSQLWQVPLQSVLESLSPQAPVVALIDDTLVRKRGRRICGTSWRRDPLGPHFTNNFIWASRFLQLSLALPDIAGAPTGAAGRSPSIWCTRLPPVSPRVAPRRSSGPAGARPRRLRPSAPWAHDVCCRSGSPSISSPTANNAACGCAPMPPSPTAPC